MGVGYRWAMQGMCGLWLWMAIGDLGYPYLPFDTNVFYILPGGDLPGKTNIYL